MKKIFSIASARPNFVKLAAVHHALNNRDCEHVIIHTGQHYDPLLSDVFFEQLEIPQPKHNLGVKGGVREEVIEDTKNALIPILKKEKPDIVLVYGDVNGALGGAQASHELGITLAHVEAGLRSGDMDMPEEHNRIAIDQLADILFCTEQSGVDHLKKERVNGRIELVGNTMIDTLIRMKPHIDAKPLGTRASGLKRFAIMTLHRPSNVDAEESLRRCTDFLHAIEQHIPVILPEHPRLSAALHRFNITLGIHTGPMEYLSFLRHVQAAAFILTDSGGIQEEAVLLKKRCFTLRKNTERPSTIDAGSNVLIDLELEDDRERVLAFAKNPQDPEVTVPPLWDGKAGERILSVLQQSL